jgi:thiamine-phosphate pyrophosphorylase
MAEVKHACRLYFQFPVRVSAGLEAQLLQSVMSADAACVLLSLEDGTPQQAQVRRLVDLVQARGIACLIDKDVELAARVEADGVHIDADPKNYAEARQILGAEANIGVGCGFSRHDAMHFAELGADYVAFGPADVSDMSTIDAIDARADRVGWWSELFVVPCVAWNVESQQDAAKLAVLGADFVAPPRGIWEQEGSAKLIAEIDSALRQARRAA